jgi:biotin operon repressor
MLLRRPSTIDDLAASLGLSRTQVLTSIEHLTASGIVVSRQGQENTYYHVASPHPTLIKKEERH